MPENLAKEIETRNQKYLEELKGNVGKYLAFLSTMARFHKYAVKDLASFALEAPAIYKAVADEEVWQKYFKRKKNSNARGIKLVQDGKIKIVYDVSETESAIKNEVAVNLWQYDEEKHKKFIDAVVADEKDIEKQIRLIAQELTNRRNISEESKKIVSLSVEAVILERMGLPTENATRKLAQLTFKEKNITQVLEETQKTAKIFLDAMQLTIKANDKGNENNLLLKEIGTIQIEKEVAETPESQIETPVNQEILREDTAEIQSKLELNAQEVTPEENSESENGTKIEEEVTEIPESQIETPVNQEIFKEDTIEIKSNPELKVAENMTGEKVEGGNKLQTENDVAEIQESQIETPKETSVQQEILEEDTAEIKNNA